MDAVSGGIKWGTDKLTQGVDWVDQNVFGGQANIITAQVNLNLGAVQSLSFTAQGILTLVAHPVKTTANVLAIFEYDPVIAPVVMPQRIPIKIKDEVLLSIGNAIDQGVQDFNTADTNHKLRTTGFIVGEIAQFFIPVTKASKAKYASEAAKTAEEMKYLGEANNLGKVSFSEMMDVSQLRLLQKMDVQQTAKYVEELKRLKETANATKAVKAQTGLAEVVVESEKIAGKLTKAAEELDNIIWRGTKVVNGETIVDDVGAFGEHIAEDLLAKNGWSDFTYIKNGSDNGIDIIAKAQDGHWGFFEVKTSSTGSIPDLSPRQANMDNFVNDILYNAKEGLGRYQNIDSATKDMATYFYNNYKNNPYDFSGNVIGVDLKSGLIRVSRWDR